MRKIVLALLLAYAGVAAAQIPTGYYNTAVGSGNTLRTALRVIIRPHTLLTYTPGLWNAYHTTDVKPNGKVWDMYSDIPGGTPAYEYTLGTDQCGSTSPTAEGSCYNREHTWPRSKFKDSLPMLNDLMFVIPTDYYVNGERSDFPYGKVGTVSHTFTNGSKLGTNAYPGAPSGSCYEPIDSFKGDIARCIFYVATCYYGADSAYFINWEMANGINLKPWAIQMLLDWHHNDPVSRKEIIRNNQAYILQGNRNPFIDSPGFADCIWGTTSCTAGVQEAANYQGAITVSQDEAYNIHIAVPVAFSGTLTQFDVFNMQGALMCRTITDCKSDNYTISTAGWPTGVYLVRVANGPVTQIGKIEVAR
jgi:endonuclease I